MPSLHVSPVIFSLNLHKSVLALDTVKSVIGFAAKAGPSQQNCHTIPNVFNNYDYILLNYTFALLYQYHEHNLLVYYFMAHNF